MIYSMNQPYLGPAHQEIEKKSLMAQKTQNFSETFVVFFMKLKISSLHSTRSILFRIKIILSILDPLRRN